MHTWGINVSGSGNSPGKDEVRLCLLFTNLCRDPMRLEEHEGKDRTGGLEYSRVLSATVRQ